MERNALVRCLFDPDFIEFLGPEREALLLRAVGMLRLNYSSPRQSPLAEAVLERIKDHPAFQWAWNRRVVAGELSDENLMVRNHALVGRIAVYAIDFVTPMRPHLLVRTLVPGDDETAAKFNRLEGVERERQQSNDRGGERRSLEGIARVSGLNRTFGPQSSTCQVDLGTWLQRFSRAGYASATS